MEWPLLSKNDSASPRNETGSRGNDTGSLSNETGSRRNETGSLRNDSASLSHESASAPSGSGSRSHESASAPSGAGSRGNGAGSPIDKAACRFMGTASRSADSLSRPDALFSHRHGAGLPSTAGSTGRGGGLSRGDARRAPGTTFWDVLGKLGVFDEAGLDPSIPVVIGRYALDLPFVREALTYGKLKNRTWIIQDNSYVFADEIYYCQTWQSFSERFDYLLDEMELQHPSPDGGRTYLTRGKQFARRVENEDEVIKLLREYDFEIVDTAGMSLEAQIRLFARTRYLVAIHGAGLINIIFRRHAPLHVLELHAANYRTEDFRDICLESNYRHDTLGGAPTDPGDPQGTNFTVDLQRLREKLELMVA